MPFRFRKPELVPTLFTLAIVALTFSLSVWQIERLHWKNALLASIDAAQSQPPEPLISIPAFALPREEWHNVTATGTLLYDKELYATPRYLNGQMGYAVLTPLRIETPAGPRYALINRGWVAPDKKSPQARASGNPQGPVTVEGVVRTTFSQSRFVPDNNPQKNLWFWYDIPTMQQATGLPLMPALIDATRTRLASGDTLKDGPTPFSVEINIRNDHLGYAITWFLMGLSAIGMYGMYYWEKNNK